MGVIAYGVVVLPASAALSCPCRPQVLAAPSLHPELPSREHVPGAVSDVVVPLKKPSQRPCNCGKVVKKVYLLTDDSSFNFVVYAVSEKIT
jgi:hypothetical protein